MHYIHAQRQAHELLKLKAANEPDTEIKALYMHIRSKMLRTVFESADEVISFLIDELPSHRWW